MSNALEAAALAAVQRHGLIKKGDTVIAALSGGADSMALFHFLFTHRDALGITLQAAHVNHGLRGENAVRDADFAALQCRTRGVTLHTVTLCPPPAANEEWAREERYAFFDTLSRDGAKIATAHTADDDAETVLFRLARGTNSRGVCGIPYRRGAYIRPLLDVTRSEVEAYCREYALDYVTDETNCSDAYARNIVRHYALPALNRVNSEATRAVHRFAGEMKKQQAYIDEQAEALLQNAQYADGWRAETLAAAHAVVRTAALAMLVQQQVSAHRRYVQLLDECVLRGSGSVQLSKGKTFAVRQGVLRLLPSPAAASQAVDLPFAEGSYAFAGGTVNISAVKSKISLNSLQNAKKGLNFYGDYDKIQSMNCRLRTRRSGDSFTFAQRKVTKTLKKWFNEQKMTPEQRAAWPLLAAGSCVIWMPNCGFAAQAAADENSRRTVKIEYIPAGEEKGEAADATGY